MNDSIYQNSVAMYMTVESNQRSLIAKIDIKAAYHLIPVARDKLGRLLMAVQQWQACKSFTKRELKSLIGTLHQAGAVVWVFISQIGHYPAKSSKEITSPHKLNASFRSDIAL